MDGKRSIFHSGQEKSGWVISHPAHPALTPLLDYKTLLSKYRIHTEYLEKLLDSKNPPLKIDAGLHGTHRTHANGASCPPLPGYRVWRGYRYVPRQGGVCGHVL